MLIASRGTAGVVVAEHASPVGRTRLKGVNFSFTSGYRTRLLSTSEVETAAGPGSHGNGIRETAAVG
jgi:hypothetical protein